MKLKCSNDSHAMYEGAADRECPECVKERIAAFDKLPPITVQITVEVVVTNQALLWDFARRQHYKWWHDELRNQEESIALEHAVAEALVNSNDNPASDQYGIEINTVLGSVVQGTPLTYQGILPSLQRYLDGDEDRRDLGLDDESNDDEPVECPTCGRLADQLGTLGNTTHYSCRYCGQEFSR
jgi:hypothetical protein